MAEALPFNPYSATDKPEWHAAYERCLELERVPSWTTHITDLDEAAYALMLQISPEVAARTLGYALIEASDDKGRKCVAREINDCEYDFEALAGLAHLYIFGFICVYAGKTPKDLLDKLMLRERRRCAFTQRVDIDAPPEVWDTVGPGVLGAQLRVAHIISQPLSEQIGGLTARAREKLDWAASAAAIIDRFSGQCILDMLGDDLNLHNRINAIMSEPTAHSLFDRLGIWLTPSQDEHGQLIPDTYDVGTRNPLVPRRIGIPGRVEFRSCVEVPPPSPILLALHASCARIAHRSGAAEMLAELEKETESMLGLSDSPMDPSFNANGAAELVRALHRIQVGGQE
ncbi:hypothetical protein OH76DRAFT_1553572 [Lentinus brumalis]|uniref:HNH nuclease domain-containing protein n=1 Tax=Lentinus brumalis TaxID=2498619 RepID=A0A371DLU5_9APHY|nr:hypothetical protein OH76DRAFT_1553572 [Polyporus brumalis]